MFKGRSVLFALTASALLVAPLQNASHAGVIGMDQYLETVDRAQALERVDAVLARDDVRQRLEQLGVEQGDAMARVHALNDAELVALADDLENLPAGGNLFGVVGVVFVVLLVLELVGVIDIFKKI